MIKPMLAYKVDKKPVDWSEKVYIQPKLDGVRCVIYVDDKENIRCFSRTGKEFHNLEHIKLSLNKFFFLLLRSLQELVCDLLLFLSVVFFPKQNPLFDI